MGVWPDSKRMGVVFTFDLDAESLWTARDSKNLERPVTLSQGEYGPKAGVPRILRLLKKYDIKATFFVTGWAMERYPARAPMQVSPEEPVVKSLASVVEKLTGGKPKLYGKAAGTDASWLVRDAGIPTVLYGPGDPRLSHTPDENVELVKVADAAKVFAVLAGDVLG